MAIHHSINFRHGLVAQLWHSADQCVRHVLDVEKKRKKRYSQDDKVDYISQNPQEGISIIQLTARRRLSVDFGEQVYIHSLLSAHKSTY
jgi:hypothetical protein